MGFASTAMPTSAVRSFGLVLFTTTPFLVVPGGSSDPSATPVRSHGCPPALPSSGKSALQNPNKPQPPCASPAKLLSAEAGLSSTRFFCRGSARMAKIRALSAFLPGLRTAKKLNSFAPGLHRGCLERSNQKPRPRTHRPATFGILVLPRGRDEPERGIICHQLLVLAHL